MNPWQLAGPSEHSQQVALFCFCAKARQYGFELAKQQSSYEPNFAELGNYSRPVKMIPELAWFHAIPNGGNRGDTARSRAIEGGRMKAEGVKPGVFDTFWPLQRGGTDVRLTDAYCGLYLEMKSEKGVISKEQIEFGKYVETQNYAVKVCYNWLEAADALQWYYNLG